MPTLFESKCLKSIEVDKANQYYCSIGGVLYNKDCTKLLTCPPTVQKIDIPKSVEIISERAFYGCCDLVDVIIPEGTVSIKREAFKKCGKLCFISIPDSVESVAADAFEECRLSKITILGYTVDNTKIRNLSKLNLRF